MLMCTGPANEALSRSRSDLAEPLVNFLFFVLFSLLFTFCSDPAEYSVNFLFWFFYCYSMFFLWSRVHCTLSHSSVNFCFWFFIITYIFLWSLFYIKTSEICSRKPSLLIIFIIIYMWESHQRKSHPTLKPTLHFDGILPTLMFQLHSDNVNKIYSVQKYFKYYSNFVWNN